MTTPGRLPSPRETPPRLPSLASLTAEIQTMGFLQATSLVPLNYNSVLLCAQIPFSCTSNNNSLIPPPNHEQKQRNSSGLRFILIITSLSGSELLVNFLTNCETSFPPTQ